MRCARRSTACAVGLGVTRAQWKVLFKLTRKPGLRQVELADMLDLEPITLCRIVDRLEEAGLVERSRDPRIAARGGFTSPQRRSRWSRSSSAVGAELIGQAFAGIDPKDIEITRRVLAQARENAGRSAAIEQGVEPMNKMATEPMTGTAAAEAPKVKRRRKLPARKGALRTILMLIVPALLIVGGGYYWLTSGGSVSTDDAQVKQDIVSVSAQVNGPIVAGVRPQRQPR